MNQDKSFWALPAIIVAACLVLVFVSFLFNGNDGDSKNKAPAEQTSAEPEKKKDSPQRRSPLPTMREISAAKAERDRLIREFPDQYYDPNNRDIDYLQKVTYNHYIGAFLHSSRRDDLRFRKIMTLLLENGYGIREWKSTVQCLLQRDEPIWIRASAMRKEGYAEHEIEDMIENPNPELKETLKGIELYDRLSLMSKLETANIDFVDKLRDVKLYDVEIGEEVIADTWKSILPGDKLYTNEDWLDAEFLAAKEKYQGEPRDPYQLRGEEVGEAIEAEVFRVEREITFMEWMAKRKAGEGYHFTYGEPNGSSFWMDEEGKIYEEDKDGNVFGMDEKGNRLDPILQNPPQNPVESNFQLQYLE